eukprot:TRINITY_DN2629_c0_g2_i1.p1 TRINITY_DN2629_c0_g2~~TRINITY_DN2629_c0_g2_i1.p1  ORF type:complete len:243 (+),score=56.44 TRINITY_DN2629_c0_g2_i1:36-764(+)
MSRRSRIVPQARDTKLIPRDISWVQMKKPVPQKPREQLAQLDFGQRPIPIKPGTEVGVHSPRLKGRTVAKQSLEMRKKFEERSAKFDYFQDTKRGRKHVHEKKHGFNVVTGEDQDHYHGTVRGKKHYDEKETSKVDRRTKRHMERNNGVIGAGSAGRGHLAPVKGPGKYRQDGGTGARSALQWDVLYDTRVKQGKERKALPKIGGSSSQTQSNANANSNSNSNSTSYHSYASQYKNRSTALW